jgi:AcrR family transcriptional regulator
MSPRPYNPGQRQANTEQTRLRIIHAARELLMAPDGYSRFSIEAVARQADVARMTVYYQFGSKIGLLEALSDYLATNGRLDQLPSVFCRPEPLEVLEAYINIFAHFWEVDRMVIRRLLALAALDPDFAQVFLTRDNLRLQGTRVIVTRIAEKYGQPTSESLEEVVRAIYTLSSFGSFDTLAGPTCSIEEVAPLVFKLAQAALHLPLLPIHTLAHPKD